MTTGEQASILVIDDDEAPRMALKFGLESHGYRVEVADCGNTGISKFDERRFDVVVSDLKMPEINGIEVLRAIKQIDEQCILLIVTGFATVESAVEALELGAFDYFAKPVNFKHMDIVIRRAVAQRALRLAALGGPRESLCGLVGASARMNRAHAQICALARTTLTVLILGETGTGKELAARAIHELSDRKDGPFIPVNCGSLPESLLESELFGHVKGAFTGAASDKKGLFDAASSGTILLDEIESASAHTQVALLRVLDRKETRPIGGIETNTVDARVIVSSNKDLESLVSKGEFREDLFFRLISAVVTMPLLHERIEDVPALLNHFLKECEAQCGKSPRRLSPGALELMMRYSWPGNVRELKHAVQQAVMSSQRTVIRPADLPDSVKRAGAPRDVPTLEEGEQQLLKKALQLANWNKSEAARILGVSRPRIYSLIAKHGLSSSRQNQT
jgi:DNA-binding NtrC family response regulator